MRGRLRRRCCPRSPRRRARSARRRSATAARSAATSPPRRRPATRCRRSSIEAARRSSARPCAARARVPLVDFVTGVKRNGARAGRRRSAAVSRSTPSNAPQTFMKVGPRNAMVIAVVSLAALRGRRAARVVRLRLRRGPCSSPRRATRRRLVPGAASRRPRCCADRRRARHRGLPAARAPRADDVARSSGRSHEDRRSAINGDERRGRLLGGRVAALRAAREARRPRAPRTRASRVSAARARCCSTAPSSAPASCSPRRPTATTWSTVEGLADGDRLHARAAGVRRGGRRAVRLLHAGPRRRRRPTCCSGHAEPSRRRDPRGALRQPLPLHRLRQDLRRRAASPRGRALHEPRRGRDPLRAARWARSADLGARMLRPDGIPKVKGAFAYRQRPQSRPGMLWGHTVRAARTRTRASSSIDISRGRVHARPCAPCSRTTTCPGEKTLRPRAAPTSRRSRIDRVPLLRRAGRARRRRASRAGAPRRRAESASSTSPSTRSPTWSARRSRGRPPSPDHPTRGHGYRDDPPAERRAAHRDPPRRPRRRAADVVGRPARTSIGSQDQAFLGPESGLAVPDGEGGVDIYVATQWLHVDRPPGRALPRPRRSSRCASISPASAARSGRPRGPLDAGPRRAARAAHEPPGHDRLQPRGVVHRARAPPPGAHLVPSTAPRARGGSSTSACSILLDGGAYASSVDRGHAPTPPRSPSGRTPTPNALLDSTVGLHRTTRPVARCAASAPCRPRFAAEAQMDKLAAALEHRSRSTCASSTRWPPATRSRPASRSPARCPIAEAIRAAAALEPPPAGSCSPRHPLRLPGGAGSTTRGEGVQRGVGFAVGFKNIAYSEGFDDYCAARVRILSDGSAEVHCAAAGQVGQGVTGVILLRTEFGIEKRHARPPSRRQASTRQGRLRRRA